MATIYNTTNKFEIESQWNIGLQDIYNNYKCEPPQFRSTWRRYLNGNNKKWFFQLLVNIIKTICQSNSTNDASVFWWLLLHYEMLILAPTPNVNRKRSSIKHVTARRLQQLQSGQILTLLTEAYGSNNNWTRKSPRPTSKAGNSAAQIAADTDNYRTAITRACNFNKIATIDKSNDKIVKKLYPEPTSGTQQANDYDTNIQELHLPGDICSTILQSG
jgi:hypothetical protein